MTSKKTTQRQGFKTNEFIVYPAHGVGQIISIEEQEVAGAKLELFVINFIKDKMTLRVPTAKIVSVGMRKLAEGPMVKRAIETLKGRARIKRTMWSRRAQEYEAKINSGDIVAIAEVVRDLFRSDSQPEQSYSERQLYEAALDRLSREIAAVQRVTETEAVKEIEAALAKGPRRGPKPFRSDKFKSPAAMPGFFVCGGSRIDNGGVVLNHRTNKTGSHANSADLLSWEDHQCASDILHRLSPPLLRQLRSCTPVHLLTPHRRKPNH